MKKAFSLILAMLMLVMTVASCGSASGQTDTTTTPIADAGTTAPAGDADTTTTAPAETVAPELQDTLPEANYNGETFTVLIREASKHEMLSEDITGDLVPDAVYQRNLTVEERFGVNIEVLTAPGNWGDRDTFINRVSNSVLGGDHEFDMVMTHNAYISSMTLRGLAIDLNELENIDFTKKWWCQKYVENIVIGGKVYSAMGDIGVSLYEYLEAVYFNKTVAEQHNITDLYETVQSGDWTFEKMMGYVKTVGSDLNGDGAYTDADLYGLSIDNHNCRYLATVWQTEITKVGSDGLRDMNLPNERFINVYNTIYSAIYENDQVFFAGSDKYNDTKMFTNDQLLFLTDRLSEAANMKEMESDYGIIPFPKYDANQEEYVSATRDSHSGLMVVSNVKNPEMAGTVIEALCMYGYTDVTPAYYETTLKLKYLSDETAMGMLDLIRDSVDFDFAILYTVPLSTMYSFIGDQIEKGTTNVSSQLKAQSGVWQKMLDKMYADFEKIAE